jgi:head-tail adaptor
MSTPEIFSERVRIEKPHHTRDEIGGLITQWVLVAERFAQVKPDTSNVKRSAEQIFYSTGYKVKLRAPCTVDSMMRLIWRSSVLRIDRLVPGADVVEIFCSEDVTR